MGGRHANSFQLFTIFSFRWCFYNDTHVCAIYHSGNPCYLFHKKCTILPLEKSTYYPISCSHKCIHTSCTCPSIRMLYIDILDFIITSPSTCLNDSGE